MGSAYDDMVAAMGGNDSPIAVASDAGTPFNSITNTLGKAADTFLDALATSGANKLVGSSYPTGQLSPAQLQALQNAQLQAMNKTPSGLPVNWQAWAIGGGLGLLGLLIVAKVLSGSK